MKQFIETIRIENGVFCQLEAHISRLHDTIQKYYGTKKIVSMDELAVPENLTDGLVKCRIVYSDRIEKIEYLSYEKRTIESLQIVEDNEIEYAYKSMDRTHLNDLFLKRGLADDIIIVKNGFVTDSSFSNLLFENEDGLFTPDTYLLNGIQRRYLLKYGLVAERKIRIDNIPEYTQVHLINAMLQIGDCIVSKDHILE